MVMLRDKEQTGFTLVEILIAMAVSATILGGVLTAVVLVGDVSKQNSNRATVIANVQNVGRWIGRDLKMAQTVTVGEDARFPLSLDWIDAGGVSHNVTYTLADGLLTRLKDGSSSVIARFIDEEQTSVTWDATSMRLIVTIAAAAGSESSQRQSASAVYEIAMRSR